MDNAYWARNYAIRKDMLHQVDAAKEWRTTMKISYKLKTKLSNESDLAFQHMQINTAMRSRIFLKHKIQFIKEQPKVKRITSTRVSLKRYRMTYVLLVKEKQRIYERNEEGSIENVTNDRVM